MGILLSAGIFALFSSLPEEQFLSWGWRVPFLFSIVVVGIGLYIRFRISETPVFEEVKEAGVESRAPVLEVLRTSRRNLLLAFGMRMGETGGSYLFQVFILTYVAQIGVSNSVGLTGVLIGAAGALVALPAFGALTDRVGRRPVYMGGALFAVAFAFPYFWLLGSKIPALIWLAGALSISVAVSSMLASQVSFFTELFDARVRYSGVALSRELSAPVSGGIAPFVATALLATSGGEPWPIALYLIALQVITMVSVYFAPETYRSDVRQDSPKPRATGSTQTVS